MNEDRKALTSLRVSLARVAQVEREAADALYRQNVRRA